MLNQTIAIFTLLDLGSKARQACGIVSQENYQDETPFVNYTTMLYEISINNTEVTVSVMKFTIIPITKMPVLLV